LYNPRRADWTAATIVCNDTSGLSDYRRHPDLGGRRRDARKVVLQPELRVRASTGRHAAPAARDVRSKAAVASADGETTGSRAP